MTPAASKKIWNTFVVVLSSFLLANSAYAYEVLDNDLLRFGTGTEASVNTTGNLQQPFYWDPNIGGGTFAKLTFSNFPLDMALGVDGDGTNSWNLNGTIQENSVLAGQVLDVSGFTITSGSKGYGTIISTGTVSIAAKTLEVQNTYSLPEGKRFIAITTKVTNTSGGPVTNLRLWVGTRDDFVGLSDTPTKERGNLVDGAFALIGNAADQAAALRISTATSGVLFYSTSPEANTSIEFCCSFSNAYSQDPATSSIQETSDGSYALFIRMADLADGESEEFTWYYAAGEVGDLDAIAADVATAALVGKTLDEDTSVTFTDTDFVDTDDVVLEKIKITVLPTDGVLELSDVPVTLNQEILEADYGNLTYTPNANFNGIDGFDWEAWDSANSVYLASTTANLIVDPVNDAPVNTVLPVISGTAAVGSTLITDDGTWTDVELDEPTFTYQWKANGANIAGATADSYLLTLAEVHKSITVVVTADDGNTGVTAATSTGRTVANAAPVNTVLPVVSGILAVGDVLSTTTGTWTDADGDVPTYTYQWKADGVDIDGATASTYLLKTPQAHSDITVKVTARDGYAGITVATSASSMVVNTAPTITGVPAVNVNAGASYSFIPTGADVDGDTLLFVVTNTPSWASFNPVTGSLTGTPTKNDVGTTTGIVIGVTDGNIMSPVTLTSFNLTVVNVNDAPTISGTPGTIATLGVMYSFTPTADDINGDSLSFAIINAPAWASFDSVTGTLSGTPTSEETISGIIISVSDGSEIAFLPAFNINAISDLDGDTIPDSVDEDIDGDGMPNTWETEHGLNPRDTTDATGDLDGDGRDNLDEYTDDYNPALDDNPPVVTPPADVILNGVGLFTPVSDSNLHSIDARAIDAIDGVVSVGHNAPTYFTPGTHIITWSATDSAGNTGTATQLLHILPLVEFSKDQVSAEGSAVSFKVILNGTSPFYPVTVPYILSGSAASIDHTLTEGSVTLVSGTEATVNFTLHDDGPGEGEEQLIITMGVPVNGVFGPHSSHTVTIVEGNVAPSVSIGAVQDGVKTRLMVQTGGMVTLTANVFDPNSGDSHSYTWTARDISMVNVDTAPDRFSFDPNALPLGLYTIGVNVNDGIDSGESNLTLNLIETAPVLSAESDSDGDGQSDESEGYGDEDDDNIPNYLDAISASNVIQELQGTSDQYLVETEPGLHIALGNSAFHANQGQVSLTEDEVENHISEQGQVYEGDYLQNIGGLFDFTISELPVAGQSVQVVLAQLNPVPENPVYRKLMASGWQTFVEDDKNGIASTAGEPGYCPPPGDVSYTAGLNPGDWCVLLTIEDGGPNDIDGEINATVEDPGGVAQLEQVRVAVSSSGGGSVHPLWLALLGLLAVTHRLKASGKKGIGRHVFWFVGGLSLLPVLLFPQADALAESWLVGGNIGYAMGDTSNSELNSQLAAQGINATAVNSDDNRTAWQLYVAYQHTPSWGVELGYVDLGEVNTTINGTGADNDDFLANLSDIHPQTAQGIRLSGVYRYPVIPGSSLIVRAGLFSWKSDYELVSANASRTVDSSGVSGTLGAGAELEVVTNTLVSLNYGYYSIDGEPISVISADIAYRFK